MSRPEEIHLSDVPDCRQCFPFEDRIGWDIPVNANYRTDFCPAAADPCLQVADYCAWALQRKWERNDLRSYNLISDRITYEYDLWSRGDKHHY